MAERGRTDAIENRKDNNKIYWSECADENDKKLVANIDAYVRRLLDETDFKEFQNLIGTLRGAIVDGKTSLVPKEDVRRIYDIINSMRPLHGAGFDLFGAVYEMFASSKEKKDFGEYFTRRHYAHLLAKCILLTRIMARGTKAAFLNMAEYLCLLIQSS